MKRVFVGFSSSNQPMAIDATREYSPGAYERVRQALSGSFSKRWLYPLVKRMLDVILSLVFIVLFSPLMVTAAFLLALDSPDAIIFAQKRIGQGGREFVCYKFRTMTTDAPASCPSGKLYDRDRYITPIGRVLRRYSLDELPQLFSVLLGKMSLVGYRPLIREDAECHSLRESLGVYRIRPGMTGYAQLAGRDRVSDQNKAILDAYYARNFSLRLDVRLLFGTFFAMLTGAGNDDAS